MIGQKKSKDKNFCKIPSRNLDKKGFMFTLDALFASIILIAGLLLISQYMVSEPPRESTEFLTTDLLTVLSDMKMSQVNSTFVNVYLNESNNTDLNLSVLEQIGTYWAANEVELAINLSNYLLPDIFPPNTGMRLLIEDDVIFSKNLSTGQDTTPLKRVVAKRMITGIMKGAPITGSTSSAYLRRIDDKRTSSYAYFGGFVGQGNITVFLEDVPSDVTPDDIIGITLELDAAGGFILRINNDDCKALTPSDTNMSPDRWDATECNASIETGRNNITLIFLGDFNESYVAGGYLKVNYKTDEQQSNIGYGLKTYFFPGIEGIINIYDSIYAPGIINAWDVNLSFYNNYTTYLVIGNETIFEAEGRNYTQNHTYSRSGLSINPSTIPIRLGTRNFSNVTQVITGEAADTILVTDTSGSMAQCGEQTEKELCGYCCWLLGCIWRSCEYTGTCNDEECGGCLIGNPYSHNVYNDTVCNRTKMQIAQDADIEAVNIILNASANRIGLVDYASSAGTGTPLTRDQAGLNSTIASYGAGGATCTCCGINKAKDMLLSSSEKKFMIVLSDGDPTYYCKNFSDYDGSGSWGGDSTGASSSETDRNWSIWAGQEACDNNITVYTIGFGEGMSIQGHETMRQTACNDSLYFNATNVSMLSRIYRNISDQIKTTVNYTFQTVTVIGNITDSWLNPNSYIRLNYTPLIEEPKPNEISVKVQTAQFNNCTASIEIPSGIRVTDAKVTSYSGEHWTRSLIINSETVYNLTSYGTDYSVLGDPYIIQAPSIYLVNGTNQIYIDTGDSPSNQTGCSKNNSLIYTALVPSSTTRSKVVEESEGCIWTIQFEDDTNSTKTIPADYSGTDKCFYTAYNHSLLNNSYDNNDAYDIAVFNLLQTLDFDKNGKVFVNLDAEDIEIVITTVYSVPYLWGPSLVKSEVWQ